MKLAEALAKRSDAITRVEQLRARIQQNATYQEGQAAAEDANALIAEAESTLAQLEVLIRDINEANTRARLADGRTLTEALAARDVLRMRYTLLTGAAQAGSGDQRTFARTTKSELATLSAVDVKDLRKRADAVAVDLRNLDLAIQQANWAVDLEG
ncbi:MAG: DIP1984 family protein [Propionibacteriaceae bacterium]|jgi:hypothetical protein|nr:DIP1984 family protein [Propionibacteriaceae bacterium]